MDGDGTIPSMSNVKSDLFCLAAGLVVLIAALMGIAV